MRSVQVSAVLAVVAVAAVVAGVVLLAGAAWGLIAFGILTAAASILLYEPAGKRPQ